MRLLINFVISVLALPIVLIVETFRSERSFGGKIWYCFIVLIVFTTTWLVGYKNLYNVVEYSLYELGITDKLIDVPIRGTSMLPTIQDGEEITLHSPKKYGLERGDIVTFKNIETGNYSYIKRLIGLENEQISIQNGSIVINGKSLDEPYVFRDDPTYGNTFLAECETFIIPKGKVAVFGDNRIVSGDSRIIGFIDKKDIDGVVKTNITPSFKSVNNAKTVSQPSFNTGDFLSLINKKRAENKVSLLLLQPKLSAIAESRTRSIASDFSSWKTNAPTITRLADDNAYQYLLLQEMITFGNLTPDQLVAQILESHIYKDEFLSGKYLEIGISVAVVENKSCQFPAISIVLGLPTSPVYSDDAYSVWTQEIEMLSRIISALQSLKFNPVVNQGETKQLISELSDLLEIATNAQARIEKDEFFTEAESQDLDYYHEQSITLGERLRNYYETYSTVITDPDAKKALQDVVPDNSEFTDLSYQVQNMFAQGNYQDQLSGAEKLIELADNDTELASSYFWSGLAKYKLGQLPEGKADLLKAVELGNEYSAPYVTLAAIAFDEENYQQGLIYATKCVELDPEYAWCHNNLGLAYLYLDKHSKAISELQKAVELDPTSYVFADNLKRARSNQ